MQQETSTQQALSEELEDARYSEEISAEEQKIQDDIFSQNALHDFDVKQSIEQVLVQLNLGERTKNNLQSSLNYFHEFLYIGQDMSQLLVGRDVDMQRAIQLSKLSVIASMQLQQTIWIMSSTNSKALIQVMARFAVLNKYSVPAKSIDDINFFTLNNVLEFLLKEIFPQLKEWSKRLQANPKQAIREIKILIAKLNTVIEVLPFAVTASKQDLFSLDKTHEEWLKLYPKVEFKQLDSEQNLKKAYDRVLVAILAANAMVHKQSEYENPMMKQLIEGLGPLYYIMAQKKRQRRAKEFFAEPGQDDAFKVWNLGENGIVKKLMPVMFQSITFNKKFYLKRHFMSITPEFIRNEYAKGTINQITPMKVLNEQVTLCPLEDLIEENSDRICVRLLSSETLETYEGWRNYSTQNADHSTYKSASKPGFFQKMFTKTLKVHDQIIIHIHGGGFVAMSSRSHQTYTRKWANSLNVPIFSIDYRMAPENPYPAGLDDIWQAYLWIINFAQYYLNVIPKRVVLVGDSAGGNLVGALTILCIKMGVRVPDGILMAYPALNLNLQFFTPSLLIALDDGLLPHTILKLCLQSYLGTGGFDPAKDPLLSPSLASDQILRLFPRTRIVVGTVDPLHDESWRLIQRLNGLNKDFYMIVYTHMPHGFLSFDTPQGWRACKVTVEDAANILQSMLQQSDYATQIDDYLNEKPSAAQRWSSSFTKQLQQ